MTEFRSQQLTGLKLLLNAVERRSPDAAAPLLGEGCKLVDEVIAQVRALSLDLRPALLDDLGVLPALLSLFGRYAAQTNIRVDFQHSGLDARFVQDVETTVYRIVQEALTNVARHAGVSEVMVRVWADRTMLGVEIVDHGTGFDTASVEANGAAGGLAGMRERASLLGGRLMVASTPGTGTQLRTELPLCAPSPVAPQRDQDRVR